MVTNVTITEHRGLLFEVLEHLHNPAEEISDQPIYHDGYTEVIITSDGSNPYFDAMLQKILLVVPKEAFARRPMTDQNLHILPVTPGTTIEKIIPSYEKIERNGKSLYLSMVTLHLRLDDSTACPYDFLWNIVDIYKFFSPH